jgi:hypothetical protein
MGKLIHTSRSLIRKHKGPHRTAQLEALPEPVHYGVHGGIRHFYQSKYGIQVEKEYPATLDHLIASVAG